MGSDNLFEYLSLSFTIASLFFNVYEDPEIQSTMFSEYIIISLF